MKLSFKVRDILKVSLSGFTLVELIVIITIIAILGTVGFVSYTSYLTTARDGNRIAQLTKLSQALQVYSAKKLLPLPDKSVTITASGTTIAYQGELGELVLQTINYSTTAKDPKDKTPFTYFISSKRKDFQLLAFMEEEKSLQSFLPNRENDVYANNYENRFPKIYGRKLGVLTDMQNTPIQDLNLPGNTLDIMTTVLNLKLFLSDNEYIIDNLMSLQQLPEIISQKGKFWSVVDNEFIYTKVTRYPNCDRDDITVGSYTIAACNIGATISGSDHNNAATRGLFFQWGNNYGFLPGESSTTTLQNASGYGPGNYYLSSQFVINNTSPYDWSTVRNDNLWGNTTDTLEARQGPCASGYHVPTNTEWAGIISDGGWGSNGLAVKTALLLPFPGYLSNNAMSNGNNGSNGYYSTSTPTGTSIYRIAISSGGTNISGQKRANGYSVRCFRN